MSRAQGLIDLKCPLSGKRHRVKECDDCLDCLDISLYHGKMYIACRKRKDPLFYRPEVVCRNVVNKDE